MTEFTLGLALFDFAPVLLTGVAVYLLFLFVRGAGVTNAWLSGIGGLLIVAAGLCKASWKLIVVLTGQDITWLANALFPLMAPGFALLAAGIWSALRIHRGKTAPVWIWAVAILAIAVTAAIAIFQTVTTDLERPWHQPVLTLASFSNILLTALLVSASWKRKLWLTGLLFMINLGMVFVLIPISQIEPMTIQIHWIEQSLTAFGTAAFAIAAWYLHRAINKGLEFSSKQTAS